MTIYIPIASANVNIPSESHIGEGMQGVQKFLIALEGNDARAAPLGVVVIFGEVSRLNHVVFPFQIVTEAEPKH